MPVRTLFLSTGMELYKNIFCNVYVGIINQSKQSIEPCDYSSQSIFVKNSLDILVKTVFRITDSFRVI